MNGCRRPAADFGFEQDSSGLLSAEGYRGRLKRKMCKKEEISVENGWPGAPEMWKLETNLDDCTGEALGYAMEKLLAAGAADVWYQPIYMKKNRPAVMLCVLCRLEQKAQLEQIIFENTTTIGIRCQPVWRDVLNRRLERRPTRYGDVQAKVCELNGRLRIYPEHEELRKICEATGLGYEQVRQEVTADLNTAPEHG